MQSLFKKKLVLEVYIPLGIAFLPLAIALQFWTGIRTPFALTYALSVVMAILAYIIWLKVKRKTTV
jgi:hypothetical protein